MNKFFLHKLIIALGILVNPTQVFAQVRLPDDIRPPTIPARPTDGTAEQQVQGLVGDLLTTAMVLTGGLAVVLIIITAIRYAAAFGAEEQLTKVKKSMVWIIGGLLLLFTSLVIIRFVVQVVVGIQEF